MKRLFLDALAVDPERRVAFLREQTDDADVRRQVERLLEMDAKENVSLLDLPRPLEELMAGAVGAFGEDDASRQETALPERIGQYRVLRKLGEGGMGIVYEAEQKRPHRRVALKVIRLDAPSEETLLRFELEAEALARLQHPGIARIYEAGTAEDGVRARPFFAMEFIEGVPLVDYAEREKLDTRQKLALLERVCAAVEHAHQRGVIHRDLKPSNILVDETGEPKVLDFGVARVSATDRERSLHTEIGQILGTLHYMSPEQMSGAPESIDTRSDVYSLGVVAFQLLAGRLPHELTGKPLPEAARLIQREEAPRLGRIRDELRGDVEAIVSKAIEKDKGRRYPSASQMAEDIRRFLNYETVLARKQTAFYQLVKLVRRHRPLVASTAVLLLALVTAAVISTRQAIIATRAREAAEVASERSQQRLEQAEEVTSFLEDMLASVSPYLEGRDVRVLDLLVKTEPRFREGMPRHPLVEASLRNAIGASYRSLSMYDDARRHLERALELRRGVLGETAPEVAESLHNLGLLELSSESYDQSIALFEAALEIRINSFGRRHASVVSSLHGLGSALRGKGDLDGALRRLEEAKDLHEQIDGESSQLVEILIDLAGIARTRGDYSESRSLYREAIKKAEQAWPSGHPDLASSLRAFAGLLTEQGDLAEAEPLLRRALAMNRRILGASHADLISDLDGLASLLIEKRELDEAETLLEEALEIARANFGESHSAVARAHDGLFRLAHTRGDYDAMKRHSAKALEIRERSFGERSPAVARSLFNLAVCRQWGGHDEEAEQALKRALSIYRATSGKRSPGVAKCLEALGEIYFRKGDRAAATPYFEEAFALRKELDPKDLNTADAASRLALIRVETDPRESERLLRFALEIERKVYGDTHEHVASDLVSLSVVLRRQGRPLEAEPLVREGLAIRRKVHPADHWTIDATECSLGACLLELGRLEEAEKLLPPAYERLCISLGRENQITRSLTRSLCELFERLERPEEAAKYCPQSAVEPAASGE